MMMMYGSTIVIISLTDPRVRDPRLWYAPWLTPGVHAAMAGLATSGTLTHWFRDRLARELPRRATWRHSRLEPGRRDHYRTARPGL